LPEKSQIRNISDAVLDAWIHAAAGKLVERHGRGAKAEAMRLLSLAVAREEHELIMLRVWCAVAASDAPA
jgi:hypothetical protein